MCECGCGEMNPLGKFRAPKGRWYVLEIYSGCDDCGLGPGVVIHEFAPATLAEEESHHGVIPELPWLQSPRQLAVPVIEPGPFARRLRDELGDWADGLASECKVLVDASHDTVKAWRDSVLTVAPVGEAPR